MGVLPFSQAVDIGLGRGRLAPDPAASLRRVDVAMRSAFGRAASINEAWRSPADADENYRKYLDYLNGHGPWAPIALPGDQSVHCFGYAVDTNDTSDAQMAIWNDHGWYWTVYRNGRLAERWHLEYFPSRDNHRNEGTRNTNTTGQTAINQSEEDDMSILFRITDGQRQGTSYTLQPFRGIKAHLNEFGARVALRARNGGAWPPEGQAFEEYRKNEANGELQMPEAHARALLDVYGLTEVAAASNLPAPGVLIRV